MRPDVDAISALLAGSEVNAEVERVLLGVVARVPSDAVCDALAAFKSAGYESLLDFDGIDTGERIELTWRLRSYSLDAEVYLKSALPYGGTLRSVWNVYASALMPERETAEMFGLKLAGHPNPKRLLTTNGVEPLLLKRVPIRTDEEVNNR